MVCYAAHLELRVGGGSRGGCEIGDGKHGFIRAEGPIFILVGGHGYISGIVTIMGHNGHNVSATWKDLAGAALSARDRKTI